MKRIFTFFLTVFCLWAVSNTSLRAQNLTWVNHLKSADANVFVAGMDADDQGATMVAGNFSGTTFFGEGRYGDVSLTPIRTAGFIAKYRRGSQVQWVQQVVPESGGFVTILRFTVDEERNGYIMGYYGGEITFGPGYGEKKLKTDDFVAVFVAKIRHDGAVLWASSITVGESEVSPNSISATKGSVSVTGNASPTITFGEGEPNETTINNTGAFFANFDAKYGRLNWASAVHQSEDGSGYSEGRGVGTDAYGNTYVTGIVDGAVILGKDQDSEVILPTSTSTDVFVAKYDAYGTFQWVKSFDSKVAGTGTVVKVAKDGSIYLAGIFNDSIDFGDGISQFHSLGSADRFVAKLDYSGNVQWARHIGNENDTFYIVTMDINDSGYVLLGNGVREDVVVSVGEVDEQTLSPQYPNEFGIYSALYDPHGALKEARLTTVSVSPELTAVALDNRGNQWEAGSFMGELLFPESGLVDGPIASAYQRDGFLAQYRPYFPHRDRSKKDKGEDDRDRRRGRNANLDVNGENLKIDSSNLPEEFQLEQNYPNPFNPSTTIAFALPESVDGVRLDVYDVTGALIRTLATGAHDAGYHEVNWDGRDEGGQQVASGVYLYRFQAGAYQVTKAMMLAK